jgi:hypothetical protein
MTTTLTQVDPPPSPTLGGIVVVVPGVGVFLRAALERAVALERAAQRERAAAAAGVDLPTLGRHIGVDLYGIGLHLGPPAPVFGFTVAGRHWHAVRGWTRDGLGYPVEPADTCTECDARARAHPPASVPAGGRSPYTVVSPWPVASPQVRRGATQRHRQRARTRSARRHNHGG